MIALIEDNREAIEALCREHGVRRLSVFGSAASNRFDPTSSDIDILIDLGEYDDRVARRYLGLIVALEQLFSRTVEVVTEKAITDPDFRQELETTAEVVYDAETRQTAA
jgi:predicted nucleotidyltransferase